MKRLWVIFTLLLLFACDKKEQQIIERHSNGEKKIVVVYEGEGANEKVTERYYFNSRGQLDKFEGKDKSIVEYFIGGLLVKKKHGPITYKYTDLLSQDSLKNRLWLGSYIGTDSARIIMSLSTGTSSSFTDRIGAYDTRYAIKDDVWGSKMGWEISLDGFSTNNIIDDIGLYIKSRLNDSLDADRVIITESFYRRRTNQLMYNYYEVKFLRKQKYSNKWFIGFVKIPDLNSNSKGKKVYIKHLIIDDLYTISLGGRSYNRKSLSTTYKTDLQW